MTLFLYVLRLLSAAVVVSAGGLFFIAIPAIVASAVHKLGGVAIDALLGYLPIVLVDLVPYLLPIGFLLALVATYGRLAADNEWTAIHMAGIHPARMALPALAIAIVLAAVSYWLTTEISPDLVFQQKEYARKIFVGRLSDVNPGQTEFVSNDFYLSAKSRDPKSTVFRDVTIHLPAKARTPDEPKGDSHAGRTILADVAEFSFYDNIMRVVLTRPRSTDGGHALNVGQLMIEVDVDDLLKTKPKDRNKWRYQNSRELRRLLDNGLIIPQDVRPATYEWHRRNTMAATYFMFLLLGVPTGLLLRRGTQLGALAAAVGYALLYYLLSIRLGKTLANWGTIPPVVGAWATTGLGMLAGLWLCWKALRR